MKNFDTFGVMLDCSRNAVMEPEALKKYITLLSKMGYNAVMLYTEDTFEVNNEPFFGYRRGRYSKQELKDIDAFCNSIGVELIPCIQTLAHLNCIFKWWSEYSAMNDCDDIMLIDDDRTYLLIENMFSTINECFSSKKIHIGMDEAYRVGLGKYLEQHGYEKRFDIIVRHLHKVCDMAKKHRLEPMIWSDMFCKLGFDTSDYYNTDGQIKKPSADLPDNVSLVYWDYYSKDYDRYAKMIKTNQVFGKKVLFAGGAWTWKGFAPDNKFSIETSTPAIKACIDNNIRDVFITVWGDDGAECSKHSVLPALFYTAELAKGNSDLESIKAKFKTLTGCDYDSFMLLDKLDTAYDCNIGNQSKTFFYNDAFAGLHDYAVLKGGDKYYKELAEKLYSCNISDEYKYLFNSYAKLAEVLSVKCELGVRTRNAYLKDDKAALKSLADNDYVKAIELTKAFHKAFKNLWFTENKPHGFDIQDIRIGGVIQRLESCKERLNGYASGEVKSIPELSEPVLEGDIGTLWSRLVSPNVISHFM